LLASAATVLNTRFPGDEEFVGLENLALFLYSTELSNRVDDISAVISTSSVPRSVSNLISQTLRAQAVAENTSNSVPVRARSLRLAYTKLAALTIQVRRTFGTAPAYIRADQKITLAEDAPVNDRTTYDLDGDSGTYHADQPEELGLWTYERRSKTTGVITVMPNFPQNDVPRPFLLTFDAPITGTFTGTNIVGEAIPGTFRIDVVRTQ
jgi:hypothetical protein